VNLIVLGVLGCGLAVLGLLGNCLSMLVLQRPKMRSSTSYFLLSLAVYDNLILLGMLAYFCGPALVQYSPGLRHIQSIIHLTVVAGYPLSLAAQMGSIYTCVGFTVERYIAVCKPLHVANTCTKSRTIRVIILVFFWSILYNIPRFFHYEIYYITSDSPGGDEFGRNTTFKHIYLIYSQLFFMFLIPFLAILLMNIGLIRAVKVSMSAQRSMCASARKEHNLTIMLIAVIVVFLVCQFPTIVDNILVAV
ncbi:hypothetical protein EGW08_000228, partial [Elysia chlorotica]